MSRNHCLHCWTKFLFAIHTFLLSMNCQSCIHFHTDLSPLGWLCLIAALSYIFVCHQQGGLPPISGSNPGLFHIRFIYILAHWVNIYWYLMWKSPGNVPFGANLTHLRSKPDSPGGQFNLHYWPTLSAEADVTLITTQVSSISQLFPLKRDKMDYIRQTFLMFSTSSS